MKSLGLLRHGALHGGGDLDIPHLGAFNLHAPRRGSSTNASMNRTGFSALT
jgi:hypothetical protein